MAGNVLKVHFYSLIKLLKGFDIKRTTILLWLLSIAGFSQDMAIDEERFVTIEGISQWITIKGNNKNNPVILFIHGGPGSTMSHFKNKMHDDWKKTYTLVHWDQRGAGKTFGKHAPDDLDESYWIKNKLTLEQMIADGIALTTYLRDYLKKDKLILIGTSWGSILGAKMALTRPDLFRAYLGHAQFVNFNENVIYAYQKTMELARASNDTLSVGKLEALGKPLYKDARSLGKMLRVVKKYERERSTPAPAD